MTEVSLHGATKLQICNVRQLDSHTQITRIVINADNGSSLELTLYSEKPLALTIGEEE